MQPLDRQARIIGQGAIQRKRPTAQRRNETSAGRRGGKTAPKHHRQLPRRRTSFTNPLRLESAHPAKLLAAVRPAFFFVPPIAACSSERNSSKPTTCCHVVDRHRAGNCLQGREETRPYANPQIFPRPAQRSMLWTCRSRHDAADETQHATVRGARGSSNMLNTVVYAPVSAAFPRQACKDVGPRNAGGGVPAGGQDRFGPRKAWCASAMIRSEAGSGCAGGWDGSQAVPLLAYLVLLSARAARSTVGCRGASRCCADRTLGGGRRNRTTTVCAGTSSVFLYVGSAVDWSSIVKMPRITRRVLQRFGLERKRGRA